ncbi:hypothetical protein [uncultured Erythrobacter sp.]|uniref:DUF7919 family protein n=1 Tax=uncultured Erythrobacter sp. TaxID=263913 RepID=UPI00262B59CB|nr:hypothetical protein [uncultured Erythrobacter sp.]
MTYFPDFAEYEYETPKPLRGVRTIGWLDAAHEFQKAHPSDEVLQRLQTVMSERVTSNIHASLIRGTMPCPICGVRDYPHPELLVGSTEIWLPDNDGGYFAAPSMIYHFISAHNYAPPKEFLDALFGFEPASNFRAQKISEDLMAEAMGFGADID